MKPNHTPKVSVNIPCYNGEKTIVRAVESILSQSFTDFELVIVNDASKDSTPQILNEFKDPRIKLVHHEQNRGISGTRNTALKNSIGEYVLVLDADDVAFPDRMKKQLHILEADAKLDGCFGWVANFTDSPDNAVSNSFPKPNSAEMREMILFQSPFPHSTAFLRRSVMANGYREDLSCAEDYAMWLELVFSGKKLEVLHEPVTRFWTHDPMHYSWEKMRSNVKKLHIEYFSKFLGITLTPEQAEMQWTLYEFSDRIPETSEEAFALLSRADQWVTAISQLKSLDPHINHARLNSWATGQLYLLSATLAPIAGMSVMKVSRRFPAVKRLKLLVKSQMSVKNVS